MSTINAAAVEAYELLRARFPGTPVCIAAESIGCGPAAFLASHSKPPEKIVMILPFDTLANVATRHYPILPVHLLLRDNWDNVASLKQYRGQLELIAAKADSIIPIAHARGLADSKPDAEFRIIEGDHNDWADQGKVKIQYIQMDRKPEERP
jgi:pimeloyl-ACP methyl ester carboxylesterase